MPHPWMLRKKRRSAPTLPRFVDEVRHTGKGRVDRRRWDERRRHVQTRARQRFRLWLSNADILLIEEGIEVGCSILRAENVGRQVELHEMIVQGVVIYAVFDKVQRYVRTVLHEEYARNNFGI